MTALAGLIVGLIYWLWRDVFLYLERMDHEEDE